MAKPLEEFLRHAGVPAPCEMQRIRAGRNSEVWRLSGAGGEWILKNYHRHESDGRDRLGTEFGFLEFLTRAGVTCVPKPLASDRSGQRALYSFLPGERPDTVTPKLISQAAAFVIEMNELRSRPEACSLPNASEACFSIQDHLVLTGRRMDRLASMQAGSGAANDAIAFISERLLPAWEAIQRRLRRDTAEVTDALPLEQRVLSQSDAGFHNTLEAKGKLAFVDFEYAGWDDPAKLICDFICQPEISVSEAQANQFMREVLLDFPDRQEIEKRVRSLLPVHRVKWVGILLNEFRREDRLRRAHAGVDSEGLLAGQLAKAKSYFQTHLSHLNQET